MPARRGEGPYSRDTYSSGDRETLVTHKSSLWPPRFAYREPETRDVRACGRRFFAGLFGGFLGDRRRVRVGIEWLVVGCCQFI